MFEPIKLKNALHPWVLLPTGLLAALFTYCARSMPINYWHHSKFGHDNDLFLNGIFPLIDLFQNLVPNGGESPINATNYLAYSTWAVVFSVLTVWLLLSVTFQLKSKLQQIMGMLLIASSVSFVWVSSFALNQALLVFSGALLLFVLASRFRNQLLPSIVLLSLVSFFSLGASLFGLAIVAAMFVGNLGNKKGLLASAAGLVLGAAAVFLISNELPEVLSKYLKNAAELYVLVDGTFGTGNDISFMSPVKSFFFNTHFVLIAGVVLSLFFVDIKKIPFAMASVAMLIGTLLVLFVFKKVALFSGYSMLFLAPLLIPGTLLLVQQIVEKAPKLKIAPYLIIGASSIYGLSTWLHPSPLNYMRQSLPYQSFVDRATNNNPDYLNLGGIMALKSLQDYSEPFDTLATNFYYNLAIEGIEAELANYFMRDQKPHDLGIYVLKNIPYELKRSAAYPSSDDLTIRNIDYQGVTLATICRPALSIRKAFKNLGKVKPGESIVEFRALTERFPQHPQVWYGYAKSQFVFSTWDDALLATQVGLSLFPDHIDMLFLQGQIYQKQKKDEQALARWDRCLEIYRGYGPAWWNKGEYYMRNNDFDEARNQLINAKYSDGPYQKVAVKNIQALDSIKAKPEFKDGIEAYYIAQINTLREQEYNEESKLQGQALLREMVFYLDLDSTNAKLRSHFGLVKLMLGDHVGAALAFEKAIEMNPNFPAMREYLAISRTNWGAEKYQQDSLEAAIFHFKYALDYSPDNQNAKSNLSVSYTDWAKEEMALENYEKAFKLLREAIYYNNDNPDAFFEMGNLKMAIAQPDSAEIAFNQAYMVDNSNLRAIEKLIELYRGNGDEYKAKIYESRLKAARRNQP